MITSRNKGQNNQTSSEIEEEHGNGKNKGFVCRADNTFLLGFPKAFYLGFYVLLKVTMMVFVLEGLSKLK